MAEKSLTIWVRAKNAVSGALSEAAGSFKQFGARMRQVWSAVWAPAAVGIAAFVALKKAVAEVVEALDRKAKALREIKAGNAAARIDSLKESVRLLTVEYTRMDAAAKNANDIFDAQAKAARELAQAQRELAKQQAIAAADPADKTALKAIEDQFAAQEAQVNAAQKIQDVETQIARLRDDAARKAAQAAELEQLRADAQAESARALRDAARYNKELSQKGSGVKGALVPEYYESLKKSAEDARKASQDLAAQAIEFASKQEQLRAEADKDAKTAIALEGELAAAKANAAAVAAEAQNKADQQRADEVKAAQDERAALQIEAEAAAERFKQELHRKELDRLNELIAKDGELKNAKINAIIEHARAEKRQAKEQERQDARDQRKADRLRGIQNNNGRLNQRQRDWLEAFNRRGAVRGAEAQQAVIQQNLNDGMRNAVKELHNVNKKLEDNQRALDTLLRMG